MHRLQTENRRLREENLTAKNNLLDMETFAKESVDGGNAEEIIRKLKQRDDEEISRIEEKVWEGRIKDAHQRIESLEQERLKSFLFALSHKSDINTFSFKQISVKKVSYL